MSEAGHTRFACESCGKLYRWKPEMAGKKAKCACGGVMTVPAEAPASAVEDLYDLAPDAEAPKPAAPPPLTAATGAIAEASVARTGGSARRPASSSVAAGARTAAPVIPYRRGLSAVERQREDPADVFEGNRNKNLYLPLGLIAVGTLIEYGRYMYQAGDATEGFLVATIVVGVSMIINVVLLLLGILMAAKVLGLSFGPVWTAILKLCAIAIGPGALGLLFAIVLGGGITGQLLGWAVSLGLYWTLLSVLFDLDANETMWCVLVIGLVRWLSGCIFAAVVMSHIM